MVISICQQDNHEKRNATSAHAAMGQQEDPLPENPEKRFKTMR
jgi:hypothetical protein